MEVPPPGSSNADELDVEKILDGLNRVQREAVTSDAEVLQILAPPGSGKTRTLTSRVAYLLAQGVMPSNIIVATFTNKASKEMKERISKMIGGGLENRLIIGTFHSIATRYLRKYGHLIGLPKEFGIADAGDSSTIISRIIKRNKYSTMDGNDAGNVKSRISHLKSKNLSVDEFVATQKKTNNQDEFSKIYEQYEKDLKNSNLLDFDDLLLRCLDLLRAHPLCVSNIEAVLIDEFQDTNVVQFDLMCLFAARRNKITIVGDPDQSIYGFRSAEIGNLANMQEAYPHTIVINLEENYRSSAAILHCSLEVIEQDKARPQKGITPTHEIGISPVLRQLPSPNAEARWIVQEVIRLRTLTGNLFNYDDIAVLVRSSGLAREIETQMSNHQIPYRLIAGTKFFERQEVKVVLDYLRVVHDPNNSEALSRILNVPKRKIGEKGLQTLMREAEKRSTSVWVIIQKVTRGDLKVDCLNNPAIIALSKLVKVIKDTQTAFRSNETENIADMGPMIMTLLDKIGYRKYVVETLTQLSVEDRWSHVEEFITQVIEFCGSLEAGLDEPDLPESEALGNPLEETKLSVALGKFLATAALSSVKENPEDEGNGHGQGVLTISTIHNAKGLEWPIVFIPGCYNGSIPHSRAEDHDEERRLLYVAMTRAQALLYLSYPAELRERKSGEKQDSNLCSFLAESQLKPLLVKRGPAITSQIIRSFSKILARDCPSEETIRAMIGTSNLERMDDWVESDEPSGSYEAHTDDFTDDGYGFGSQRANNRYQRSNSGLASTYNARSRAIFTRTNSYQPSTQRTTMSSTFSTHTTTMQGFRSASSHMQTLASTQRETEADARRTSQKRKSDNITGGAETDQQPQRKAPKKKVDKPKPTNTLKSYFQKPLDSLPALKATMQPPPTETAKPSVDKTPQKDNSGFVFLSSSPDRNFSKSEVIAQNRKFAQQMRSNPPVSSKFTSVAAMVKTTTTTSYTAPTTMSRMSSNAAAAGSGTNGTSGFTSNSSGPRKTLGMRRTMVDWKDRQRK